MIFFLTAFWQTGLPFAIMMGLFYSFQYGWRDGLAYGAFGGFLFGLCMASFLYFQTRKFRENRPLDADEKLIWEGPANHHGNGGWLYLTDSRMLYLSHKVNIKTHELEFPLADVVSVERGRTLGVIPNKLILNLRNGKREEFGVQSVKNWVGRIERESKLLNGQPRKYEIHD